MSGSPQRPASALPRYSMLAMCVRAAIFGAGHPLVRHMAGRNHALNEQAALDKALAAMRPAQP